jgi:outer membrane protein OmpA-like peptidoglycan-associated protein
MTLPTTRLMAWLSLAGGLSGCAGVPHQLLEARLSYAASCDGPAAGMALASLNEAKNALDEANLEFDASGDTAEVRDLSYVAKRKVDLADVRARIAVDRRRIVEATRQGVVARLAGAMKDLAATAAVRQEPRGLVIRLSSSILFASGEAALLEPARTRLDRVADVVKAHSEDRTLLVEDHTDSQGTDATNQLLSLDRASAVRDYLVGCGIDTDRIGVVGMGSGLPLLDNGNLADRGSNRWVEIIIRGSRLAER